MEEEENDDDDHVKELREKREVLKQVRDNCCDVALACYDAISIK